MYKLMTGQAGQVDSITRIGNEGVNTSIPLNPANSDYQQYLAWLSEGNEPLPADEVSGE